MSTRFDLVSIGRSNMDLYSQQIGAAFEDVQSFDAMVGGSPTNIAIGVSRLGLRTTVLTAVGDDRVGDYILRYLRDEKVDTSFVPRKPGKLTSLALLGVRPPSDFPLSFYREDPADIYLDASEVERFPFAETMALQVSGNALSRGPCAPAAIRSADLAAEAGCHVFMDLDLRPTEWATPASYGAEIRAVLSRIDTVIGTEEEFYAALMPDPEPIMAGGRVPEAEHDALDAAIDGVLEAGPSTLAVKRGERGVTLVQPDGRTDIPTFPVEVLNTVGAGDAFASGLIRSLILGWEWPRAARFANACGAIVVTRHGCSAAFPTEAEVEAFVESKGGW